MSTVNLTYTTEMKQKLWQLNMLEAEHYLRELFGKQGRAYQPEILKAILLQLYETVDIMENAKCVLADLVRRGCKLYAVTSNYYDLAEIGLKSQQLLPYFTTLYSCLSMGYADKEQAFFQEILEQERLNANQIIYVEDSLANLKKARKLGVTGIYLANSDNPQAGQNDTFVTIDSLDELTKIVKEINNDCK